MTHLNIVFFHNPLMKSPSWGRLRFNRRTVLEGMSWITKRKETQGARDKQMVRDAKRKPLSVSFPQSLWVGLWRFKSRLFD